MANDTEGRKRVRRACSQCKIRKRRCDGKEPCSMCIRLEINCYYELGTRKSRKLSQSAKSPGDSSTSPQNGGEPAKAGQSKQSPGDDTQAIETNANSALTSRLERTFQPSSPAKKDFSSWNLGIRQSAANEGDPDFNITALIVEQVMQSLASAYFDSIGRLYRFVNRTAVEDYIRARWRSDAQLRHGDPILLGVALIGSVFSEGSVSILPNHLYDTMDIQLSKLSTSPPTPEYCAAVSLKTLYLRSTSIPYAAWMSSCTGVHVLEVMNQDTPNVASRGSLVDKGSLIWTAYLLNTWVSNEYGRVSIRALSSGGKFLSFSPERQQEPLNRLFVLSTRLDPGHEPDTAELEATIGELKALNLPDDPRILSQANLALAVFRRLRFRAENVPPPIILDVIHLGMRGLEAVKRLARVHQPWWHVVNVPFQFLCTVLVMDTPDSLAKVGSALSTLEIVAATFPSQSVLGALGKARKMVSLAHRRKRDDANIIGQALKKSSLSPPQDPPGAEDDGDGDGPGTDSVDAATAVTPAAASATTIDPEQLAAVFGGDVQFDFSNFANTDWFSCGDFYTPIFGQEGASFA